MGSGRGGWKGTTCWGYAGRRRRRGSRGPCQRAFKSVIADRDAWFYTKHATPLHGARCFAQAPRMLVGFSCVVDAMPPDTPRYRIQPLSLARRSIISS